jgi:phosphoenolpyruvate-protein kinase (PTS system EI component)
MTEQVLVGLAASPGMAAGVARVLDVSVDLAAPPLPEAERPAAAEAALAALAAAAAAIDQLAAELGEQGNTAEAEIVATGSLMAADPGLTAAVSAAVLDNGASAPAAILLATESYAATLAAIDDPNLQLRSDDVRSLGRRAARLAVGGDFAAERGSGGATDTILVASDLGPADVAELGGSVRAVALAGGGTTAHAAIVARSLGVPMVVGAGEALLRLVGPGTPLVVDGDSGSVTIAPGSEARRRAQLAQAARLRERERVLAASALPAETTDGRRVKVLANVATPAEVGVAVPAGADGVGLLRTELAFLDARHWPTSDEHRRALAPTLAPLTGFVATVRLLDFGGDKTPPFLAGTAERGIALLLGAPEALAAQAEALAGVASHTELRVLLPMVEDPQQIADVRAAFAARAQIEPPLGAMIETARAVERVDEIAAAADFLSIGTNDLTHSLLDTDRFAPSESAAHHPRVLRAVAAVAGAAHARGRVVEVCGEAASHPIAMPLLIGLGVDELSVGAARVGKVRQWVRSLQGAQMRGLARQASDFDSAAAVAQLMRPVAGLLGETGDAAAESVEGSLGVVPVGTQA